MAAAVDMVAALVADDRPLAERVLDRVPERLRETRLQS